MITRMSVAIWLTGPLSLTGSLLEKIGQLTIPYRFNTYAESSQFELELLLAYLLTIPKQEAMWRQDASQG